MLLGSMQRRPLWGDELFAGERHLPQFVAVLFVPVQRRPLRLVSHQPNRESELLVNATVPFATEFGR